MTRNQWLLGLTLVVLTAGLRLIEHPWNIAPMGALALFCGAHLRDWRWALAIPLISLALGDVALGAMHRNFEFWTFHPVMLVSAACYMGSVGLGMMVQRSWRHTDAAARRGENDGATGSIAKILPVIGATLAGGMLFFLVTNFAVWGLFPTYPRTFAGLVECYWKGIPFYRNTLLSDSFYVAVMFSGYAALRPVLEPSEQADVGADLRS